MYVPGETSGRQATPLTWHIDGYTDAAGRSRGAVVAALPLEPPDRECGEIGRRHRAAHHGGHTVAGEWRHQDAVARVAACIDQRIDPGIGSNDRQEVRRH